NTFMFVSIHAAPHQHGEPRYSILHPEITRTEEARGYWLPTHSESSYWSFANSCFTISAGSGRKMPSFKIPSCPSLLKTYLRNSRAFGSSPLPGARLT